jgi:hypothetical protein
VKHLTPEQRIAFDEINRQTSAALESQEIAVRDIVEAAVNGAYRDLNTVLKAHPDITIVDLVAVITTLIGVYLADVASKARPFIEQMFLIALERATVGAALLTNAYDAAIHQAFTEMRDSEALTFAAAINDDLAQGIKATAFWPSVGFVGAAIVAGLGPSRVMRAAQQIEDAEPEFFIGKKEPADIAPGPRSVILSRATSTRMDNIVSVRFGDRLGLSKYVNIGVPDHVQCDTCWLSSEQDPLTLHEWQQLVVDGRFRPTEWKKIQKVTFVSARKCKTPLRHPHCRCRLSATSEIDEAGRVTTGRRYQAIEDFLNSQEGLVTVRQ